MHNVLRPLLIAVAVLCAPAALAQTTPATLTLKNGARTEVLSKADLAAMPQVTVSMPIKGEPHVFEGVPLTLLLQRIGAPAGETGLHGDPLASVVVVRARDGYAVALALAETDASMRKDAVILATKVDGAAIPDADGPYRLVVAADLRPARSAKMVESLEIKSLKDR